MQKVATTKKQRGASERILHCMGEGCISFFFRGWDLVFGLIYGSLKNLGQDLLPLENLPFHGADVVNHLLGSVLKLGHVLIPAVLVLGQTTIKF
jgi:hypothetical protein